MSVHTPLYITVHDLPAIQKIVNSALRRHAARYRCRPQELDDLRQDGLIAALAASSTWRPDGGASYSTWVNRRVQGQLITSTRALRGHGITGVPEGTCPEVVSQSHDPEVLDKLEGCTIPDQMETSADEVRVIKESLSCSDWDLLDRYFGLSGREHTVQELATADGVSPQAVYQRLTRLLRRCKKVLAKHTVH